MILPAVPVFELPDPDAKTIAVVCTVKGGPVDGVDFEDWRALGATLLDGTMSYTRSKLFAAASQGGFSPRVIVMRGWMHIVFELPASPDSLAILGDLSNNVVRMATLDPERVRARRAELARWAPDAFTRAATGFPSVAYGSSSRLDLLYRSAVRPDSVFVTVAGSVQAGEGAAEFAKRFSDWRAVPGREAWSRTIKPSEITGAIVWQTAPVLPNPVRFAELLVASIALGAGKTSALHRVVREDLRLSYQQQTVVWPTRTGWIAKALIIGTDDAEQKDQARKALLADIEKWNPHTLERSLEIARQCLRGEFPMNPIWLSPNGQMGSRQVDRAEFAATNRVMGGEMTIPQVEASLDLVDLDAIKSAARAMLQ